MNKNQKISQKLKESWDDPGSGFNSLERSLKLSNITKENMKPDSELRKNLTKMVKHHWADPNSKYNSKEFLEKMKIAGSLKYIEYIDDSIMLCDYGCGNIATFKYIKQNKYCCSENWQSCPAKRKESKILVEKERMKPDSLFHSKECSEKRRSYMLNGGALRALRNNNTTSKPQLKLYKMVCEICPYVILEYPCINYKIDIAIPQLNIAIEYDGGYFHSNIEYDKRRQDQLEDEGWKFIRYRDYIPTKTILMNDIKGIINK